MQTWCHPHWPSSYYRSGISFEKQNDPRILLSLTLGLTWHPLKSPSHQYVLGQVCLAPLFLLDPENSVFLPRRWPCVMFHGHLVQDTFFMAMCGHGVYICVHTYVCVACSSFCSATLLPAPLPSMSQMSLPWLQSAISWKCRGCPSESWQPPLVRVCFAEQNVNPSLDGLLDLFN